MADLAVAQVMATAIGAVFAMNDRMDPLEVYIIRSFGKLYFFKLDVPRNYEAFSFEVPELYDIEK